MPTSAPGNRPAARRRVPRGFTLIEIMIVIAIIAIGAGLMSLTLRDSTESRLEEDAARLAALFESARAVARTADLPVRWQPQTVDGVSSFRFSELPPGLSMSSAWIHPEVTAEVVGGPFVRLGPEPVIGEQHVMLRLGERRIELVTDGLGPFLRVAASGDATGAAP